MKDYRQTSDGDIDFTDGDLGVTESTYQHQRDLLCSDKGHIRDKPEAGVGAVNYLHDNDPGALLRATRKEFTKDGMKVRSVGFSQFANDLNIDAHYADDNSN